jgi:hypothetical protein
MGTKNKDEPNPPTVPRISAKKAKKMKRGRFAKENCFKDVVSKVTPLISPEVFFVLGWVGGSLEIVGADRHFCRHQSWLCCYLMDRPGFNALQFSSSNTSKSCLPLYHKFHLDNSLG